MKISVTSLNSDIFITLNISEDLELENFKALCEFETWIPAAEIELSYNGVPLQNPKTSMKAFGLNDGDVLLLQHMHSKQGQSADQASAAAAATSSTSLRTPTSGIPRLDFSNISIPSSSGEAGTQPGSQAGPSFRRRPVQQRPAEDDPISIRNMLLSNPEQMALLKERNPPLADALLSGSTEKFVEVLEKQRKERSNREMQRMRLINADPFDAEAQSQIAEEIRIKNVEANMETAIEYAPEFFGQVVMLYVNCSVNGQPVKAFVDSGAQMTIMSQACAERCNIMRLVDRRWAGIAKGVGTQKIIGRVHLCQIQIEQDFLHASFSILQEQPMDMLLGLDMLKRHQCCIDLREGQMKIGTTNTSTPFLSENDLPECARLNFTADDGTVQEAEDRELSEALQRSAADAPGASSSGIQSQSTLSSSGGNTQTQTQSRQNVSGQYPEEHVQKLIDVGGVSRTQALEELHKQNGNVDLAVTAIIAKSLKF